MGSGCRRHAAAKAQREIDREHVHDVVESDLLILIAQLLTVVREALLIGRDTFLVLDFGLDIVNNVAGLNIGSDGLAGQRMHKDLHTSM